MPNSNPQAITFANTRARPMADALATAYMSAKKLLAEWSSQNVAAVIPNDATIIADGSAIDGRAQITDAQVTQLVGIAQQLCNWFETGQLASGGAVTNTVLGQVAAIAVNGAARF